jgi:hypothetical protein
MGCLHLDYLIRAVFLLSRNKETFLPFLGNPGTSQPRSKEDVIG